MNFQIKLFISVILLSNFAINCQNYDYCDVLKKSLLFYKAQRAGKLPDIDVPWRGPSAMNDSYGSVDLSGGYFDAGDHVKFALPMAYSITMLSWSYIQYESNINQCGLKSMFLETIKYGSDWLISAHISPNEFVAQVGNGGLDHSYWGPPELMQMQRPVYIISSSKPGTEVAMEAAAALSATSIAFSKSNPSYSANCLSHAKQLHDFGYTFRGVYSDVITDAKNFYNSWSGYKDELVWGSIWLYKATNDESYLSKAKSDYSSFGVGGMAQSNSHDWDLKAPGATLLLYQITKDSQYQRDIESHLKYWLPGGGVSYTPGGLAWIRQWGPNRYAANSAFLSSVYFSICNTAQYGEFTKKQINYLLGSNPSSRSYVIGVGSNFPKNPHHRASHHSLTNNIAIPPVNTYELTGALVGGPGQNDDYVDDRSDYIKNEVACDYNAAFTGAIASLITSTNSKPISVDINISIKPKPVITTPVATTKVNTNPPVATTQPPATNPPVATTQPPATNPPVATTQPPATTKPITNPPVATTQPPATTKPITFPGVVFNKPVGSSNNEFYFFKAGELNQNVFDYSWGSPSEHSLKDNSHLYNGQPSIAFKPNNWNAIYLGCQECVNTAQHQAIELYIHGGDSTGAQQLTLGVLRNSGASIFKEISSILLGSIKPNQWNRVFIKFSDLGINQSVDKLNGIWIQSTFNGQQSMVYIANIRVI